jgi:hypothetical protein
VQQPEIFHHLEQYLKFLSLKAPKNVAINRWRAESLLLNIATRLTFSRNKIKCLLPQKLRELRQVQSSYYKGNMQKSFPNGSRSWATTGRTPSFWSQISGNLKTKTAGEIGMQITELIHHLIPSVQQTINSEPTRKHEGTSRLSTRPPIMVVSML